MSASEFPRVRWRHPGVLDSTASGHSHLLVVLRQPGRILALAFLVAVWLAAPTTLAAPTDDAAAVLSGTDAAAAIVVSASPRCAEPPARMPEVKIHWQIDATKSATAGAVADLLESTDFRVDVSVYPRFDEGTFESLSAHDDARGPEDAKAASSPHECSLIASNLEPGVYYATRVLVNTPDGWVASETVRFLTPICPVDGID